MDKTEMTTFWDQLWSQNMWWPAFTTAAKDLSAQQASWKPQAGRHSIWQNLNHICFWREVVVRRVNGEKPAGDELERRNFEEPAEPSDAAWRETIARFERSQKLVRDALASGKLTEEKFKFMVPHDAYHMGQIMYLRALQEMPAIAYEYARSISDFRCPIGDSTPANCVIEQVSQRELDSARLELIRRRRAVVYRDRRLAADPAVTGVVGSDANGGGDDDAACFPAGQGAAPGGRRAGAVWCRAGHRAIFPAAPSPAAHVAWGAGKSYRVHRRCCRADAIAHGRANSATSRC